MAGNERGHGEIPVSQQRASGEAGMRQLRVFLHRIAGLVRRDRRERELTEEIESNLQLHIADNMRAGMSAGEARRQALIVWGGVEWTKEAYRDQRGLPQFDTLLQDIRYAV